jgi:quercetin 2,3-dioxygenase
MNTPKSMFVREVARNDDPQFVSGQVAGHRARRLIDARDAAFADPFVLMVEDWTPQRIFPFARQMSAIRLKYPLTYGGFFAS